MPADGAAPAATTAGVQGERSGSGSGPRHQAGSKLSLFNVMVQPYVDVDVLRLLATHPVEDLRIRRDEIAISTVPS